MIVDYIDAHRGSLVGGKKLGVEPICGVLRDAGVQIAPSSFYAAKSRPPSARSVRDSELVEDIRVAHAANLGVYGARKIHAELNREGVPVARCTVERLMRAEGLRGIPRAKTRRTTIGDGAETERPEDPGETEVRRDRAEPAVGGRPDLCPHALRMGLRRVRPRRVLPDGRRLAGVHVAATPTSHWTPSTWACGPAGGPATTSPV